jgi:hypothetical protein
LSRGRNTVDELLAWIASIWWVMSSVASAVWFAKFLTSDATTANPFPDSPARAYEILDSLIGFPSGGTS